jgi:hypothetical protein
MKRWLPVLALFAGLGSSFSFAQYGIVDCVEQKTLTVPRIRGQVFDATGVPVPGALVSVSSDTRPELQLKTDASGQFNFKVSPGRYMLKASFSGFEVTRARLDVGADILNLFHPTALRVILSVGSMDCPWSQPATRNSKNSFTNMPCGNELH